MPLCQLAIPLNCQPPPMAFSHGFIVRARQPFAFAKGQFVVSVHYQAIRDIGSEHGSLQAPVVVVV